jgi:capsule polysaccharide export protein KpsE/RkpR
MMDFYKLKQYHDSPEYKRKSNDAKDLLLFNLRHPNTPKIERLQKNIEKLRKQIHDEYVESTNTNESTDRDR